MPYCWAGTVFFKLFLDGSNRWVHQDVSLLVRHSARSSSTHKERLDASPNRWQDSSYRAQWKWGYYPHIRWCLSRSPPIQKQVMVRTTGSSLSCGRYSLPEWTIGPWYSEVSLHQPGSRAKLYSIPNAWHLWGDNVLLRLVLVSQVPQKWRISSFCQKTLLLSISCKIVLSGGFKRVRDCSSLEGWGREGVGTVRSLGLTSDFGILGLRVGEGIWK